MTTIFIDADACPVTGETLAVARAHSLPVVLVANRSQNLARYASRPNVEIMQVASGPDSADYAMVPCLTPGDIVVTQDIGLAAMALAKGARAVGPRGRVYMKATIDAELALRHAEQKHRRAGGRTGGPAPFRDQDREHFRESLERLLAESIRRLLASPILALAVLVVLLWGCAAGCGTHVAPSGDEAFATVYDQHQSGVQMSGSGTVSRLLADDDDGSRHQRFILSLASGQTLLVAHNIDVASRIVGLQEGDRVDFSGVYEWNSQGGLIHWTHHDPDGVHERGWIEHEGVVYE